MVQQKTIDFFITVEAGACFSPAVPGHRNTTCQPYYDDSVCPVNSRQPSGLTAIAITLTELVARPSKNSVPGHRAGNGPRFYVTAALSRGGWKSWRRPGCFNPDRVQCFLFLPVPRTPSFSTHYMTHPISTNDKNAYYVESDF